MTENNSKLQQRLLNEIQQLQKRIPPTSDSSHATILGAFLEATLRNQGIPKERFAAIIDAEEELVDALLEGLIPEDEIDDDLIVMMATAADTQPNILRILLGRTITATGHDMDEARTT